MRAASLMCVLWFGARQVISGHLTPGQLSAFVVYSVSIGQAHIDTLQMPEL